MVNGIYTYKRYSRLYGYACPDNKYEHKLKQIIAMTT